MVRQLATTRRAVVAALGGATVGIAGCTDRIPGTGPGEPARPAWATRWTGPDAGPARRSAIRAEGPTDLSSRTTLLKNARLTRFPLIEGAGGQYAAIQRRDRSRHLLASHAEGGRWEKQERVKYLAAIDETLVVGYGGEMQTRPHQLVTLDPSDGSQRDIRRIGDRLSFSNVLTGPETLAYTIDKTGGRTFRVEAPIGETAWEVDRMEGKVIESVQAAAMAQDTVVISVHADAGGDTFVPYVAAYDRESGSEKWVVEARADQLTLGAEQVFGFAFARDGGTKAIALAGTEGTTNWETTIPVPTAFHRCLTGERLVVGKGQSVVAVDTTDGSVAWEFESTPGTHTLAAASNAIYVGTDGAIHCLTPEGEETARTDFGPLSELSVSEGTLFVPRPSQLFALRDGATPTSS
jgi:outer membrane protein assembly factor BamB